MKLIGLAVLLALTGAQDCSQPYTGPGQDHACGTVVWCYAAWESSPDFQTWTPHSVEVPVCPAPPSLDTAAGEWTRAVEANLCSKPIGGLYEHNPVCRGQDGDTLVFFALNCCHQAQGTALAAGIWPAPCQSETN